jgi:hypothetical protein
MRDRGPRAPVARVRGGSCTRTDGRVLGGLRQFDRRRADGAPQLCQVEEARGSDVGPDRGTGPAGWNANDPAEHRHRENGHDESANREPPGKRLETPSGDRGGRCGCRHNGMQRVALPSPERLSAWAGDARLSPGPRAVSKRNQLLAWTEPVARKRHYVVDGPRLLAAVVGFRAFRLHAVAAPPYRICRSFPSNRDGVRPPGR